MKNRLKELRINRGLSQKNLINEFNLFLEKNSNKYVGQRGIRQVTSATESRWENGLNKPTSAMWQALSDYFDVNVSYLQGYPFAKCHWCGNEFVLVGKKDRDMYFYCPYCGRSPLDFGDKKPSAETKNHDEKQIFLKLEKEKDTLDDAIEFLNELIGTSESLTNVGKVELTKVVRVLYNIYYDDTHACWKTK
ncbi:helix-turn-helix transcriptional regulator [Lactobacillus taiwanensis]|uniref:helix-turn-helix transcriptional regulator n=1 Tax=Lactobacillus taiwanensis TaxID=508451 RepID=UPI00248CE885|nr:helix-turn-helix transcriptional regulator [Lactobacillus taiwanensis]